MKRTKKCFAAISMAILMAVAPFSQVVAFASEQGENSATITILHTNDMHGRLVSSNTAIGIDLIAGIHAATENSILVDAGDMIHGLPFVTFNQGLNAVRLMNAAGYSFLTPGNHEFNYGISRLLELRALANFEILVANLTNSADDSFVFEEYSIIEMDGVRVGFFGIAYPGTPLVTHPSGVVGLDFSNPVVAARRSVSQLQEHGVDVIVAITHLGVDGNAWGVRVAEEVDGIDVLIDGHSHTLLENGQMISNTLVAQAGDHGRFVGVVEIEVSNGEIISRTASVIDRETAIENFEPVASVSALISEMEEELGETLNEVVATSPVTLYGDSPEHRATLRGSEVPLGNLIADASRLAMNADLALLNSGGIRTHLNAGDVTRGDIIAILPFFNYAVVVEITPVALFEALENGVSNMPGNGRFPQISGFSFVFDQNLPEGERVLSVTLNGEELLRTDNETTFSLVTNDFMASGGDGYEAFMDLPVLAEGGTFDEILIAHMAIHNIEDARVEGRIINIATSTEAPTTRPTPLPAGTGTVVNCYVLNVRAAGATESSVVGHLRAGTVVEVLESVGTTHVWHRVTIGTLTGWVYGAFLQVN